MDLSVIPTCQLAPLASRMSSRVHLAVIAGAGVQHGKCTVVSNRGGVHALCDGHQPSIGLAEAPGRATPAQDHGVRLGMANDWPANPGQAGYDRFLGSDSQGCSLTFAAGRLRQCGTDAVVGVQPQTYRGTVEASNIVSARKCSRRANVEFRTNGRQRWTTVCRQRQSNMWTRS